MHTQREAYLCLNKHDHIISASASVQNLLGYTPVSLLGQSMEDLCVDHSALHYLQDSMLLKGCAEDFRICLKNKHGKVLLLDCCAAILSSPDGAVVGTELLLKTIAYAKPEPQSQQLKVSIHGNILQANTLADSLLHAWDSQRGKALPQFLATEVFQCWATGQVTTKESDLDYHHIYIFVPQTQTSLITIHVLPKFGLQSPSILRNIKASVAA